MLSSTGARAFVVAQLAAAAVGALAFSCGSPKADDADEKEDDGTSTDGGGTFTLAVNGLEFDGTHHGHVGMFALVDRTARTIQRLPDVTVNGAFNVTATKALTAGHDYYFDYVMDVNGNGKCDAPPTDHTWRRKINTVTGDTTIEETHHMGFTDVCATFDGTLPAVPGEGALTVSGTLKLDPGVTAEEGVDLTPGQALVGATVFLEGDPTNEARTDSQGAFVLAIDPGAALAAGGTPTLVMWYTVPAAGKATTDWASATARFGTRKELQMAAAEGDALALGETTLTYTQGVSIPVKDEAGAPVPKCWLDFAAYGFQLVFVEKEGGVYQVDYLPPGTYDVTANCIGFEPKQAQVTVGTATASGQFQEVPAIVVKATAAASLHPH
jgi:hypothetical protein